MKNLFLIALGIFSFFSTNAQTNIVESGEQYLSAFIDRDFEKVISMTHSHLVELGGGSELMIKDLYAERQSMVDSGMDYVKGSLGTPGEIVDTNKELQAIIPVTFQLVMNKQEVEQTSHLLAISNNGGESWSFLDVNKYDKESLKTFIPSLSDKLTIPE
ncbi:MAG: hypothetical protein HKO66_06930 [Saprospiraceae bacterium]|nr:hypothetical protein [Bacteroidia bacterium]NNE15161.1 hypothetical protein [Saprospiraceae bacterium]NNL91947.1 hypothetical protein [Saprospiraceae bacterium]